MKTGYDNFTARAIQDIIKYLKEKNTNIVIYEPTLNKDEFDECKVINNLEEFKNISDVIVANRLEDNLKDSIDKVYTRDLYTKD